MTSAAVENIYILVSIFSSGQLLSVKEAGSVFARIIFYVFSTLCINMAASRSDSWLHMGIKNISCFSPITFYREGPDMRPTCSLLSSLHLHDACIHLSCTSGLTSTDGTENGKLSKKGPSAGWERARCNTFYHSTSSRKKV